jgi:hypothetical protein
VSFIDSVIIEVLYKGIRAWTGSMSVDLAVGPILFHKLNLNAQCDSSMAIHVAAERNIWIHVNESWAAPLTHSCAWP